MQVTTAGADAVNVFNNYGYGFGRCAQALVHTLRRLNARALILLSFYHNLLTNHLWRKDEERLEG